jgi:hypothetical protein
MAKSAEIDQHAKHELELYIYNTSELHNQFTSIVKNLQKKIKALKYDHAKAPKLWEYWVEAGAKMYCKEFGCTLAGTFPASLRRDLAKDIADREFVAISHGEYK